ncbi:MAG: tetratricopeptide repeat protein [Pseudomonadota bacterium]
MLPILVLLSAALALALPPGSPAHAQDPSRSLSGDGAAAAGSLDRAARLDALFAALAASDGPADARTLATAIWVVWFKAPDDEAQALFNEALVRRRAGDFDGAIAVLDTLTQRWPDYAEGWNQRATLFYLQGRFALSLADVSRVLALEPRHFGALTGRGLILFRQGRRDAANRAILEALRVHPFLAERALLDPGYGEQPL